MRLHLSLTLNVRIIENYAHMNTGHCQYTREREKEREKKGEERETTGSITIVARNNEVISVVRPDF